MLQPTPYSRGRNAALAGTTALALAFAMGLPMVVPSYADTAPAAAQSLSGLPQSYADIVAMAKPAVVTVTTELAADAQMADQGAAPAGPDQGLPPEEFFKRFFGENGPMPGMPGQDQGPQGQNPQGPKGMALGSGFVISEDGYVVTNNHVIDHATKITVTLDDGKELTAKLVGRDAKNDIAVLKVTAAGKLPTIAWGTSDNLRAGDPVVAIGDPFGIGTTVTSGIVSARGRDLHNGPYDDFIQIDAAINHGNSGGPLVDVTGKVVGINTAIYSPNGGNVGVGFAIPSKQAQAVVEKIIKGGSIEHGFIGVSIQGVDDQIAGAIGLKEPKGALVAGVQDGSPAGGAGVKTGDVILSVNGNATATPRDVSRMIADLAPGDQVTLGLWRGGKEEKVAFKVGQLDAEKSAQADQGSSTAPDAGVAVADLGFSVTGLSGDMAQQMGLDANATGAVVSAVDASGPAADKGIQQGDLIVSINQTEVKTPDDVTKLIGEAKAAHRPAALLLVERGGNKSFIAVPFKAA